MESLIICLYHLPQSPATDGTTDPKMAEIIYSQRHLSFLFLLNMLAWLLGAWLLHYEYRKSLSEAYYTHWLYWILMFLQNLVFFYLNFAFYEWYLKFANILSLFLNGSLCVMMCITKRRTIRNPRPFDLDTHVNNRMSMKKALMF